METPLKRRRTAQRDLELLKNIQSLMESEKYPELIQLMNERLQNEVEINHENREFYYVRAIATDNGGDPTMAFAVLSELRAKFPTHPQFYDAFKINCARIEGLARDLYCKDHYDPVLKSLYNLLFDHWYPYFWLTVAVSKIDVKSGKISEARQRMNALLELSPNDSDYLRGAFDVALQSQDQNWISDIVTRAVRVLKDQPYRIPLYRLLSDELLEGTLNPDNIH
jgi:predicted Zn-dependent protease